MQTAEGKASSVFHQTSLSAQSDFPEITRNFCTARTWEVPLDVATTEVMSPHIYFWEFCCLSNVGEFTLTG